MAVTESFARRLLRWFRRQRRDLPWRHDRSAYHVLVSEIMLQQTTAAAVVPYFERFVAALPSWRDLAEADPDRVVALWSGLGYYRRARNLHAAAQAVVERHDGRFPASLEDARALPGIGPYTAGAVLSLSRGLRAPAVDGNVARVLSRHLGRPLLPARTADRRELEAAALERMPQRRPGEFNEALIELGALTCTTRSPACGSCPVRADCRARLEDRVQCLPPPRPRRALRELQAAAAFALHRGRVLLARRAESEPVLPGMWELPGGLTGGEAPERWLAECVLPGLGGGWLGEELCRLRHAITDRRITVHVHSCTLTRRPRSGAGLRWASAADMARLPVTGATIRLLERLLALRPPALRGARSTRRQ